MLSLHHTHMMASNIQATIMFWQQNFDADIVYDATFAGARNVFLQIGTGRIHLYDQCPKNRTQGVVHHIGVETNELEQQVSRLSEANVPVTEIRSFDNASYAMVEGPDKLLIELFQVDSRNVDQNLRAYFDSLDT